MAKNQIITVVFKGVEIGKIGYDIDQRKSFFQFHPEFLSTNKYKGLFPYIIRRVSSVQVFSEFEGETFRGLPPMIADSLPDAFGNLIFKEWLEFTHKETESITPLEQLAYVGQRGMGALEFIPSKTISGTSEINIEEITEVIINETKLSKATDFSSNQKEFVNLVKEGIKTDFVTRSARSELEDILPQGSKIEVKGITKTIKDETVKNGYKVENIYP